MEGMTGMTKFSKVFISYSETKTRMVGNRRMRTYVGSPALLAFIMLVLSFLQLIILLPSPLFPRLFVW